MDMSGWLTVAPRLESVNGPAAFLPCCKKFKLMWHSGHVGARHARWFMLLISSRGHFKWKHREFANFTARHCRGKKYNTCVLGEKSDNSWLLQLLSTTCLQITCWQHSRPTATQTKQQVQKRIYVITIWIGCGLIFKAIKRCGAEGNSQSAGLLVEHSKLIFNNTSQHQLKEREEHNRSHLQHLQHSLRAQRHPAMLFC